jgi:ribosomal protein S18 acetylase RimI-like enzyme
MRHSVAPFTPSMLAPLVDLINTAIRGRREAAAVAPDEFRERVLAHPGFDPAGLLVVPDEDGSLLGAVHAIIPPASIPHYARLAGRGYIFGPYVRADARGRGLGRALLGEAERTLASACERVFTHGLRAPFYHAQEGPRQPYCGSTEIIGLNEDDVFFLDFLRGAGYEPLAEEQEVSMVTRVRQAPATPLLDAPEGFEWARVTPATPWDGPIAWAIGIERGYGYDRYRPMADYDTLALIQGGALVGECQWYPMRRPGRAVMYSLRVAPEMAGRGLGSLLLAGGLALIAEAGYQEVELHTSPQRNAVAWAMYRRRGFREVANWVVMTKLL